MDVLDHASLTTSLVSFWELEEASGTRVDAHGANDLADNNTVTSATGKVGDAADFEDANSEYLSITDAAQTGLDITGDFSFNFWVNFESDPDTNDACPIGKYGGAGTRSYLLQYIGGGWRVVISTNGTAEGVTTTVAHAVSTATWYNIGATYDVSAGTLEIFVNGSSIGTGTGGPTSIADVAGAFNLGRNAAGGNYFDGLLDQVGVWTKLLSSTEMTDLYNGGAGLEYDGPVTKTVTDTLTLTSATIKSLTRKVLDTLTLSTEISALRGLNKTVTDTLTLSSTVIRSLARTVTDTLTLTTSRIISLARTVRDTLTLTTIASSIRQVFKTVTDTLQLTSIVRKVLNGAFTIWSNIAKNVASWTAGSKNTTTWDNEDKSS